MNPHHSPPERVGWFGKIPALGDFVTRHLPPSFVQPWDEWLSAELSEARLLLLIPGLKPTSTRRPRVFP